jgi:hypothetical protein
MVVPLLWWFFLVCRMSTTVVLAMLLLHIAHFVDDGVIVFVLTRFASQK